MTGATTTESKRKLTRQKNPVRKRRKGEKQNNNNKEESPTKLQCLNTSQNPEQRLETRKQKPLLSFLFEKRRIHHETGEGNGGEGKEGKREGKKEQHWPGASRNETPWLPVERLHRLKQTCGRNRKKREQMHQLNHSNRAKDNEERNRSKNRNSEEGGGHHHLVLLLREELQTLIPGPQSQILIFQVPKTKCPRKTKLPISSPQSK